jgi:Flp pilus assembly protein TadD
MEYVRTLETALGWLELGLPEDSLRELQSLSARDRMRREALEMKLSAEMQAHRWNAGADTGRLLCLRDPKEPRFFINAAFCLHETGDTLAARNWLMTGPSGLIDDPLFHYNIACYHAVLGERKQARSHLARAIAMDDSFRAMAAKDRDLAGLKEAQ